MLLLTVLWSGCVEQPKEKPLDILTFTVEPARINIGETAVLSWVVTGATSVVIDGGIGTVGLIGNQTVTPIETVTYTIKAENATSNTTATTTLTVINGPVTTTPVLIFTQIDTASINTLTVESITPTDTLWADIELLVNGTEHDHMKSGTVTDGDVLNITSIAGTGAYTITFKYTPTNTTIADSYVFTTATTPQQPSTPTITFTKIDTDSINTLTVSSVSRADVLWSNISLRVDGISKTHGQSGFVSIGNVINLSSSSIAGTGAYTITFYYTPTSAQLGSSYTFTATGQSTPTINFTQTEASFTINTLTVQSVSRAGVNWSDIELRVNGEVRNHNETGVVTVGNVINMTQIAGTGSYLVTLTFKPTNEPVCTGFAFLGL